MQSLKMVDDRVDCKAELGQICVLGEYHRVCLTATLASLDADGIQALTTNTTWSYVPTKQQLNVVGLLGPADPM